MPSISAILKSRRRQRRANRWIRNGRIPGAKGSDTAKWIAINHAISSPGDGRYGWNDAGLDERVVEYPWLFERLRTLDASRGRILDAGSVLNHRPILDAWRAQGRSPVSIVTLGFEQFANVSDDVRYEFADLRELPYRDRWFSHTISLSTVEHIGLDNRIYGSAAGAVGVADNPSSEARRAMLELHRVTASGGSLLLSVPFGAPSNRGWLRIFDAVALEELIALREWIDVRVRYFRARSDGWRECSASDAADAGYNEPFGRGGQRTAPDHVAAAEAVALVEMKSA